MQGREDDRIARERHAIEAMEVSQNRSPWKSWQHERDETPSPRSPKQASRKRPLATNSKSREEPACDFLLNALRLAKPPSWGSLVHVDVLLATTGGYHSSCLPYFPRAFKLVGKFQLNLWHGYISIWYYIFTIFMKTCKGIAERSHFFYKGTCKMWI